jgi:uncharacterized protein YdeI (YjbR/CyaY-like superfamily)
MNKTNQVDQYILKSPPFAIPILNYFRALVHAVDDRFEESIKWGMPFFELKGTVCHMAAFKKHCAIGFWKGSLMQDEHNFFKDKTNAMGQLGKIQSLNDLPEDEILISYIQEAIKLNEDNIKLPAKPKTAEKVPLIIPQYFIDVLQKDPKAMAIFQNFSPSNKKDYVLWLEEAKTEATRLKRLDTALEWIADGKPRMWKYLK